MYNYKYTIALLKNLSRNRSLHAKIGISFSDYNVCVLNMKILHCRFERKQKKKRKKSYESYILLF